MEITKITKRTYIVSQVIEKPFMKFGVFRQSREKLGLNVEKTCFCCGHKFFDDEDVFLAFFKNTHNRLLCENCNQKALIELKLKEEQNENG